MDMVESSVFPNPVIRESGESFEVKDFALGQNNMILKGMDDKIYLCGARMYHYPRLKNFSEENWNEEDPVDMNFGLLSAGKKHFTVVNYMNQILTFGDLLGKSRRGDEIEGFTVHDGSDVFDGYRVKQLSAKYGVFGAIVE